jgi:hypothetical protein
MTEIEYLLKQNAELIQGAQTVLVGGGVKDYAEYRELVGFIRGLNRASSNLQDLDERKKKENDE